MIFSLKNKKLKYILICMLSVGLIALFFNNTRMAWIIVGFMFIVLTACKIKI